MEDKIEALLSACRGKLEGKVADPDFLQKAALLAQLSEAAYGAFDSGTTPIIAAHKIFAAAPGQALDFKPVFEKSLSKLGSTELAQQYGIWEVAGLGVVVAFKGCRSPVDQLAQQSCQPCSIENQSQFQLHEGIYQGVAPCCKELAQACRKLCFPSTVAEHYPLFLTGMSTLYYDNQSIFPAGIAFQAAAACTGQCSLFSRTLGWGKRSNVCFCTVSVLRARLTLVIGTWWRLHIWRPICGVLLCLGKQ